MLLISKNQNKKRRKIKKYIYNKWAKGPKKFRLFCDPTPFYSSLHIVRQLLSHYNNSTTSTDTTINH
jgi:hypothetical protein